jgi:hypothetical protein
MLEAACGSVPVRFAASKPQLSALTDVLHKLRVLTKKDVLLTVSQLLGLAALARTSPGDEAENLLARLRVPPEAGPAAPASTLLSRRARTC